MRIRLVMWLAGKVSLLLGLSMLVPLGISLYFKDGDSLSLLYSMLAALAVGIALLLIFKIKGEFYLRQREGFMFVTVSWLLAAILGSLPYYLSGVCPDISSAFFESMSGFTTTGASIFTNVEAVPRGILFWRSLTHWLGGMGIVVLFVAILSGGANSSGFQMYKAEAPGNSLSEKITPKISDTSKILWITYVVMSFILVLLLFGGGMSLYDSLCHAFATMATGGFSTKNISIGYYDSAYIDWVTTVFMILAGSNLAAFYVLFTKKQISFWKSDEFKFYILVIITATLLITANLLTNNFYPDKSLADVIRYSAFQVASIITTTGYATTDFNLWPSFSQLALFILLFFGGCSGSTSGAIKMSRIVVLLKNTFVELARLVHPKVVRSVKFNRRSLPPTLVSNVLQFFTIYIFLFFIGSLVMAAFGMSFTSALTSVASCLGNVGPGLDTVGPMSNYSAVAPFGKVFLSIYMLLGRLELYTVLVLLVPAVWKK